MTQSAGKFAPISGQASGRLRLVSGYLLGSGILLAGVVVFLSATLVWVSVAQAGSASAPDRIPAVEAAKLRAGLAKLREILEEDSSHVS